MKCMYIVAVAVALVSAAAFTGCEKKEASLSDKIEQASKDVQKAAEKTAKDVEKAAEKAADDAKKAADDLAK
ncbi:MAG: hypothetical protein IJI36_06005 [Kiritimatiellae bacterium]|nr:hypothetical protein [Kiritimatiellia bacterium]